MSLKPLDDVWVKWGCLVSLGKTDDETYLISPSAALLAPFLREENVYHLCTWFDSPLGHCTICQQTRQV